MFTDTARHAQQRKSATCLIGANKEPSSFFVAPRALASKKISQDIIHICTQSRQVLEPQAGILSKYSMYCAARHASPCA